jgi:glycosyltransferase involved in cell wall biosynthesis
MAKFALSVVIPTNNRSRNLHLLLESLNSQQQVPFKWEILVIDNGSKDNTKEVINEFSQKILIPIRYIYEDKPGLHFARHRGATEATGEIVAYLDDDTVLASDWISGAQLILSNKADAVVSRILPQWETPPPVWLIRLYDKGVFGLLTLLDMGETPKKIDPSYVWGASFFIRRSLILDLGGFNPDGLPPELIRFRGDGESGFFRKFKKKGYSAWYYPQSIAYHCISEERMTMEYLCKRSFNQGISDSFTQIRKISGSGKNKNGKLINWLTGYPKVQIIIIKGYILASKVYNKIKKTTSLDRDTTDLIAERLKKSYWDGWNYHQSELVKDVELMKYVLREHYFD